MVRNVLGNDIEKRGERSAGYGFKEKKQILRKVVLTLVSLAR
jgi:hypothetical protein